MVGTPPAARLHKARVGGHWPERVACCCKHSLHSQLCKWCQLIANSSRKTGHIEVIVSLNVEDIPEGICNQKPLVPTSQ